MKFGVPLRNQILSRGTALQLKKFILSIQELQYEDNTFRQFCNPTFDRDNIIKSSA